MKTIRIRVLCGLLIVGVPLLLLAACSGGGGGSDGSSTASSTATTGTVHLSLTDNQTLYNAVVLTIVEVGIVASDTATTYYNATELDNLPLTVNVLDFPGKATLPLAASRLTCRRMATRSVSSRFAWCWRQREIQFVLEEFVIMWSKSAIPPNMC